MSADGRGGLLGRTFATAEVVAIFNRDAGVDVALGLDAHDRVDLDPFTEQVEFGQPGLGPDAATLEALVPLIFLLEEGGRGTRGRRLRAEGGLESIVRFSSSSTP